jgi:hypothetical protein
MGSESIESSRSSPSLLAKQLAKNGFAIVENPISSTTLEAIDVLNDWFQLPRGTKQLAAPAELDKTTAGRGFFALRDKEVLEVKQKWDPRNVQKDVRLVVREVSRQISSAL